MHINEWPIPNIAAFIVTLSWRLVFGEKRTFQPHPPTARQAMSRRQKPAGQSMRSTAA